jgi:lysophospholipase L1-like esterase
MDLAKQIQIYGDSIMKGVQLDTASERYYLPKENNLSLFQEEYPLDIRNNSKFGCTIEKGCQQLQKALNKDSACDMVLLEYGGNDCDYDWAKVAENPEKEHLPHTDIHTFEKVYRKMLSMLKEHGVTPIMMSLHRLTPKNT